MMPITGIPSFSRIDRKSTRLNSSHLVISYAVFCLKKKNKMVTTPFITLFCPAVLVHNLSQCLGSTAQEPVGVGSPLSAFVFFLFFFNDGAPPDFYLFPRRIFFQI